MTQRLGEMVIPLALTQTWTLAGVVFLVPSFIAEGWNHPALQTFMASKGYSDYRDIGPHDLKAVAWNLEKLLRKYQGGP
ncbi:MAG: hypothetical protein AAGD09_11450 [Cyanobacteria bacterium P01_F01_bin.56]